MDQEGWRTSEHQSQIDPADNEAHTKDTTPALNPESLQGVSVHVSRSSEDLSHTDAFNVKSEKTSLFTASAGEAKSIETHPIQDGPVPDESPKRTAQREHSPPVISATASVAKNRKRGRRPKHTRKNLFDEHGHEARSQSNYEPKAFSNIETIDDQAQWLDYNSHQNPAFYLENRKYGSQTHRSPYPLRAATLPYYQDIREQSHTPSYKASPLTPDPVSGQRGAKVRPHRLPFPQLGTSREAASGTTLASTVSHDTPQNLSSSARRTTSEFQVRQTAQLSNDKLFNSQHLPTVHMAAEEQTQLLESGASSVQSDELIFSVPVQCSHATLHSRFSTLLYQHWPERTAQNDLGVVWVRKARSSKRFKKRDGLHSIELACHNGPMASDAEDYQIQWLYVHIVRSSEAH
jgi:hypothetical protein